MQSSQVRNVGLPSSAETKRDVPAWTQDPKIFSLDWFSVSRPNIIRQTKEYVSELSKWRNCPKIKTVSKLKAVLKRIMMFLHTHTSYIDGKSLLECDLEEDLITLVSLYIDMELRVLLVKKSTASDSTSSGQGLCKNPGPGPDTEMDTARNDKLVADRISYWLYTVLTGHEQRLDALLSITVFTRHTRPVLDPIFRKILSEMSDGPFSSVNYVRHMLAYKTWRERALLPDDTSSEELNTRVLQQLFPRDSAFPPPLLRCLGKGASARDHARPHNVNLSDACRNFIRFCRGMPAAVADQINFESIPLFDDDMLSDEENEVNKLMNMISDRKQRKSASLSLRSSSFQVDAFIDLTLPKTRMKSNSSRCVPSAAVSDVIDLTKEDEKPVISSRTSSALEPSFATLSRTASAVQRISASKKVQPPQIETHCFTTFREQDLYLVNISCMCPVRAHRQRECQCQDKNDPYFKNNKALKTKAERKCENDTTFVGPCFQFSIGGNQYTYPNEDDVDTEIQPIVVGNSQDEVKMEMKTSASVTCISDESETRDKSTEFCDELFPARLNLCDCDECTLRYENRTCISAETLGESENEHSDNNVRFSQKPLVTCTKQVSHLASVADIYAMKKTSPILLLSQASTSLFQNENEFEHFSETNKRKLHLSENITQNNEISQNNFKQSEDNLSCNSKDKLRIIKLPLIESETDVRLDNTTNLIAPTKTFGEISEYIDAISPQKNEAKFTESTNTAATPNETVESEIVPVFAASTNVVIANTIHDKNTLEKHTTDKISLTNAQNENSDTVIEIENLCTKLSETGFSNTQSIVPELSNVVEKDEVSVSKELLPKELSEDISAFETQPACHKPTSYTTTNVAETNVSTQLVKVQPTCNVPIIDTPATNVAETNVNVSTHLVEVQPKFNVSIIDTTADNGAEANVSTHLAEIQPTCNVPIIDTTATNVAETDVNISTHLVEVQPKFNVSIIDTTADNGAEANVSTHLAEIQPTYNVPIIETTATNVVETDVNTHLVEKQPILDTPVTNVTETNVSTHIVDIQPTFSVPIIETIAANVAETNVNISTHLVEIQPTCNVPIIGTTAANVVETDASTHLVEKQPILDTPVTNVTETNVSTHLVDIQPAFNVPIIDTTATNVAEANVSTHLAEIQPTYNVSIIETTATNVVETEVNTHLLEKQPILDTPATNVTEINVSTHLVDIPPTFSVPIIETTAANVAETNVNISTHLAEIQPTCNVPIIETTAANVTETNVSTHLAEIQPTCNVPIIDTTAANITETNINISTHLAEIQPTCNVPIIETTATNVAETNVSTNLVEVQPTCNVPIIDTTAANVAETNVSTHLTETQPTFSVPIIDTPAANSSETNVSTNLTETQPTCNVPKIDTTASNFTETNVSMHLVEIQPTCNVPIIDTTTANRTETNVSTHLVEVQPTCNVPIIDTPAANVIEANISTHLAEIQPTCNVPIIETTAANVVETDVSRHLTETQPTFSVPIIDTTAANGTETNVSTHLVEVQPICNVPIIDTTAADGAETNVNISTHLTETQPTCNVPIIDTTSENVIETNVSTHRTETQPTFSVPIIDTTAANGPETNVNISTHLVEIQPILDTPVTNVTETNVSTHLVDIQPTFSAPIIETTATNVAETNVNISTHLVETQPTCNVPIIETTAANVIETNVSTHLTEIQPTFSVPIIDRTAANGAETNVSTHLTEIQPTFSVPIIDRTAANGAETNVSTHLTETQPTCNVPIIDTTAANVTENNISTHFNETQVTCKVPILETTTTNVAETNVSTHLIDATAKDEKSEEVNNQPYMVESIQIDVSQERLEEKLITNTEEKIDSNTKDTVDDQVTNEVNLAHSENSVLEQTCIEFIDQLAPEQEIIINSEVVVESISEAADTCHELNISNENQLEHVSINSIDAELSPFESNTIKKQDLQVIPIKTDVQNNLSDAVSNSNNMRKRRMSSIVDTKLKEISVDSKSCLDSISYLSPRKRPKRKLKAKTNDKTSENKYDQQNVDTLHAENRPEINDIHNNSKKPNRRKSKPSDEVTPDSEIFRESKLITNESEPVYENAISGVFEDKSVKMNHRNLASKISADEKKPDSKGMCEQESVKENISTDQNSKEERPKRRRKQNLKYIIKDDKLTSPITLKEMVKEDQSNSSTQKKDKKLCVVCKILTQSEIDQFRKNKCSPEIRTNIISVEENKKLMKSKHNEDIGGLVSNNLIEDTTKLTEKGEQTKLSLEKKNTAIVNSSEIEFNKNLTVTSHSDSTKMEIKAKIQVKSKRKKQVGGSNEDKIKNKATKDQIVDSTQETMKRTPIRKLKRSRGRPPKTVSNKLKFFAENFNLQNLDSKTTKSDVIEEVNSLETMKTSSKHELSEEDIPLAYRMSQSVSQKKNSFKLKLNPLSNVENKLVNPEEDLPRTTRRQKLKASQSSMKTNDSTVNTKLTSEPITKTKSFRNKLEKFKFQPRDKPETNNFTTEEGEAETLSLKKSNKCLKTYRNTKAFKAQELSCMSDLIQPINSKKSKSVITSEDSYSNVDQQSISTEINSEDIKNEEISSTVQTKEFRDDSTKIHNDVTESATIKDKIIANTVQKIEETYTNVDTKSDDLVTEISKSKNLCVINGNPDISPENLLISPVEKSEFTKEETDDGQIIMKTEVDEHNDIFNSLNQLPTNLTSDCRSLLNEISEVNIKRYTKPANINSHLTFVPKLLSKKAKEKLFALEMKTNLNEKLDVVKETDKKDKETPESKNILNHKNKNSSKLITSNEQEIITNKDEEITVALSETCEKTINSDEILPIPSEELCIKLQSDKVDKNVGPIELPINNNYEQQNNEITLKGKSDDTLHSVRRPLKMRKSKFPKLKLKMNSKNSLILSRILPKNVKNLPKGKKSKFNQRKKEGSNDHIKETLLSVMRKTKKTNRKKSSKTKKPSKKIDLNLKDNASNCLKHVPTANSKLSIVKDTTESSEQNVQICVNNQNEILNHNNTTKSIEFTNDSVKKQDDDKLNWKICPVDINNQNISEDIIENTESTKIDNKTDDMLHKPSNKIYEKHFDFYSDQDDVSNSELIIDTSAESSDAEESATCNKKANKINSQIQTDVVVSKQSKYHHSIAEIVNLNEKSIPVEDKCIVNDNDFTNSSENKICQVNTLNTSDVQTVINRESTVKHQKGILSSDQEGDMFDKMSDSSLIPTISEMVNITEEIQHINDTPHDLKVEIVSVKDSKVQKEDVKEVNKIDNLKEHTAVTTEIPEEISDEFNIAIVTEEKIQQFVQPFGPTVEMSVNIEIGLESCTISQKKIEGELAKESCVKCSVNGKHKENKRVTIRGIHHYEQNNVEECLDVNAVIPAIPYCQAMENYEPNACTLISKIESVEILTDNSSVPDNYNLLFLADIAMNTVHLNNENTVVEITTESSNEIHNQRPLQKDERCVLVSIPEKLPTSNKSAINLSIINSNQEEVSLNIQKLAGGVSAKGILLENKIQALAERVRNGTRVNGDNLNELYESLENICELEISTITKTSPKPDGLDQHNPPNEIPQINSKISEPNITIDIPNTALLHLTPDDDDFMMRNEPFSLQPQPTILQPLPPDPSPKSTITVNEQGCLDSAGIKNLYKVLVSLTNNKKEINSENEHVDCDTVKIEEKETKTKTKKGRSKLKSSNNQSHETSYLLNKYKNKHDCNKQIEINISNNKNTSTNPQRYIRSTQPMRVVTTKKRSVNVLDTNCPPDEPAKKVSASEKMFDKLLEEHKKEISEAKLKDETIEDIFVNASTENKRDETKEEIVCLVKDATMPILENSIAETNKLSTNTTPAEGLNIPVTVLEYKMSKSDINDKLISPSDSIKLVESNVTVEGQNDISVNQLDSARKEDKEGTLSEDPLVNTKIHEQLEITEKNSLNQEETIKETILINSTQSDKNIKEQIINTVDRNISAVEVVQNWFNRVDANKTDSYAEIASDHTIEECSFFEEISNNSENSPNARKSDEKVFTEHQTPDSGIAFDEDSVQKDKSIDSQTPVLENLSDSETMNSKSYFHNLGESTSGGTQKVKITDIKMSKSVRPREVNNKILKVSIALERIKDIIPLLTKHKMISPERKMKKRKDDFEKGKKRKHSTEEIYLSPVTEHESSKTLLKDSITKRRKYSEDDNIVEEGLVEEIISNQKNISSTLRTKGSVKEYPDCLFGITESPVPSGSFNSPYPSDISLTEEPTFYEEGGMVLFNDYPCYNSFEVLQEQQSLQREYNVVDDNPKDVQQGLQAGYCVVDSQFLPLPEYMNDGEYILIDNNIFNDKRMVPVNMHEVQPEAKPHNTEELKRSEFDDSEKEDNLSETVDEIIKNPDIFTEQSTSEVQVISMDQATSKVQVVISCDTYQETEMPDTYLFGIDFPSEVTGCDGSSTAAISEIQHSPVDLEEATPESKVTNNLATPVVSPENTQFCNTRDIPVIHVTDPVPMDAVDSISETAINQDVLNDEKPPEQKSENKKLTNTFNNVKTTTDNPDEKKKKEKSNKLYNRRLSSPEPNHLIVSASKTPSYSSSVKNYSKIEIPASTSAIYPSTPVQNGSRKLSKSCFSKSSKKLPNEQFSGVFENKNVKELETKACSSKMISASNITSLPYKNMKKYDYHQGSKILNKKNPYSDQKLQKPLVKTYEPTSPQPNKKQADPKIYPKPNCPNTYSSKVPKDAFDKLKEERTDITPPDNRNRYSSSSSDSNIVKNHQIRKNTQSADNCSNYSDRVSSSSRHSESRRHHSAYTEHSSQPAYRPPSSDSTHRSSQYNYKKSDMRTSPPRNIPEQDQNSPSSSYSHDDWWQNEQLLKLIKSSGSKRYL